MKIRRSSVKKRVKVVIYLTRTVLVTQEESWEQIFDLATGVRKEWSGGRHAVPFYHLPRIVAFRKLD